MFQFVTFVSVRAYTPENWFFGLLDMIFRFCLVAIIPYVFGTTSALTELMLLLITLAYVILVLQMQPYVRASFEQLRLLCYCCIMNMYSLSMYFGSRLVPAVSKQTCPKTP